MTKKINIFFKNHYKINSFIYEFMKLLKDFRKYYFKPVLHFPNQIKYRFFQIFMNKNTKL